jgi:hypothetical protein
MPSCHLKKVGMRHLCHSLLAIGLLCMLTACTSNAPPSARFAPADPPVTVSQRATSSSDLLYVTDQGDGSVYVYAYPQGTLLQHFQYAPLQSPTGDCIDDRGNVFITGYNGHDVLVYSHGASQPWALLMDPGYPSGCSVDPRTHNLAVANVFDRSAGAGNVAIWTAAIAWGGPTFVYSNLPFLEPAWCSYDDKGNLFVDGQDYSKHQVRLAELPKGATSFERISLKISLGWPPGKVQWDGKYVSIAVGNVIYRLSFSGSKGHVVGSTQLPSRWSLQGYTIVGASPKGARKRSLIGTAGGKIGVFQYPSGSGPSLTIPQNYPLDPVVST